jgi:SAM-dependent MidA family methyltransferase
VFRWREAMASALYGPDGFFVRPDNQPAAHFRTSTHASPLFAGALLRLLEQVDAALGHPDRLDLVDIGAGRGELLTALLDAAPPGLAARLHPVAVEIAPRPDGLSPSIHWRSWSPRAGATSDQGRGQGVAVVVACEWLDNVPVDVAEVDPGGAVRYVLVDPATGEESFGEAVTGADLDWLRRWWPLATPGTRAEIGRPRDEAWARVVAGIRRGLALAVDYGHVAGHRPPCGTLTGFRRGREVAPIPDGSCDLTAHVAMDALAAPSSRSRSPRATIGATTDQDRAMTQREALRALGVDGTRPPLELAHRDPAGYLRRLAAASQAAELTDPAGLGGHHWLLQPVALPHPLPAFMAR